MAQIYQLHFSSFQLAMLERLIEQGSCLCFPLFCEATAPEFGWFFRGPYRRPNKRQVQFVCRTKASLNRRADMAAKLLLMILVQRFAMVRATYLKPR